MLYVPLAAFAGGDGAVVPLDGGRDLGPVNLDGAKHKVPQDEVRVFGPHLPPTTCKNTNTTPVAVAVVVAAAAATATGMTRQHATRRRRESRSDNPC